MITKTVLLFDFGFESMLGMKPGLKNDITFCIADHSFIESIRDLINSCYRGDSARQGWTHESDLLGGLRVDSKKIENLISKPDAFFIVAKNPLGELMACVFLKKETNDTCYLGLFAVRPDLQNAGLGRKLLEEAEKEGSKLGCKKIRLTVIDKRVELISYYERRGFRDTGVVTPFPANDPMYVLKVSELKLRELVKVLNPQSAQHQELISRLSAPKV